MLRITSRGVSFRACLGNFTGFDVGVRGLLKGPQAPPGKTNRRRGEGAWSQDRLTASVPLELLSNFPGKTELQKSSFQLSFDDRSYEQVFKTNYYATW